MVDCARWMLMEMVDFWVVYRVVDVVTGMIWMGAMSNVSGMIWCCCGDIFRGISVRVAGRERGGVTWGELVSFCNESLKKERRRITGIATRSNVI